MIHPRNRAGGRRRRQALRPFLMALEGRALLATFTVNSLADDGSAGTLRWAIGQANQAASADSIVFSSLFDTPRTITLTGGSLALTGSAATTIAGPGANRLTVSGGGNVGVFLIDGDPATISGLTITGGSASVGAGVRNDGGNLTLAGVTVRGNTATGQGGGVATRFGGTTRIVDSTVSGNAAAGGAGLLNASGTLNVVNSTITGNASPSGAGGGVFSDGNTTLFNATIAANTGSSGGGLAVVGGSATLTNTIVGANLGGDVSGTIGGTNNLTGVDPKLSALGDYGGPTFTMAPQPGSPAIGGGTPTGAPATDQRGQPRTGRIDIGAFEAQVIVPVNDAGDGVGSDLGEITLRQAVNLANGLSSEDAIVFDTQVFKGATTIALTAGPLVFTDAATTTFTGPGAGLLTLSGNNAGRVVDVQGGSLAMQGVTITGGNAAGGGGIRFSGGRLVMTDAVVTGNKAVGGDGGGLLVLSGAALLNNVSLTGNRVDVVAGGAGQYGGGLASRGSTTLTGCTVSGNSAISGGGLAANAGNLVLTNCTVTGNTALGPGGGLGGQGGGVLANQAGLAMTGSTVGGNTAKGYSDTSSYTLGGGVFSGSNTTSLANCTIAGNTSDGSGGGLALLSQTGSTIANCTVTANSAGFSGGGLSNDPFGLAINNSIIAGQKSGGDITSGAFTGSGNVIGVDPALAPLGWYGGPTQTAPPLPGSPALGAGTAPGSPTTDQRGLPRSGRGDAGAFQTQPALVVNTVGDGNTSALGTLNLRQAINLANASPAIDAITFSDLFSTPKTIALVSGQLSLTDPATTTISGPGAALLSITGNGASRVFNIPGGSAALTGLTITGGNAGYGQGGGILASGSATLSIDRCVISGNSAYSGGALATAQKANAVLTNSTLSGNLANGNSGAGGGIYHSGYNLSVTNCTITGNVAGTGPGTGDGGAIWGFTAFSFALTNCTIVGNTAYGGIGGVVYAAFNTQGGTLLNSIVTGNPGGDTGGTFQGSNNIVGTPALLGKLGNYGGPTPTIPILPGSPAIGGGAVNGAPTTDQRGLPRNGKIDVGAFQSQGFTIAPAPGSNPQSTPINTAFPKPVAAAVTAKNPIEPVDGGIVQFSVTPVGGASATLSAASAVITNGQAAVTATANGTTGTYVASATSFGVGTTGFALINTEAAGLTVTTITDVVDPTDGLTSLREAIAYANAHEGPDTIVLSPGLVGRKGATIRLVGGPLVLTDGATTTIRGPGAARLTIRGDGRSRVFDVQGGSLALSGLAIANGRAGSGGGVRNLGGQLEMTAVTLRGNRALLDGGGLYNEGIATLRGVTFDGNSAGLGGGIANLGRLTIGKLAFRGNRGQVANDLFNRGRISRITAVARKIPRAVSLPATANPGGAPA
ncbi:MAG: choice-of-anchor Q domain-containing protein [Isosphaeraceae bacterium]